MPLLQGKVETSRMSDNMEHDEGEPQAAEPLPEDRLIYESNPKHSEPWQPGRKGSICDKDVRPLAQDLLEQSVAWGDKRYAVVDGKAYCAQQHLPGRWHGYPVGWRDVPPKLRGEWLKRDQLKKRDVKKYWDGH